MPTRRDFLKNAVLLSAATGIAGAFPDSIERALAIDPKPGSTWRDAEHAVILMQENRSFDHCFGALRGVRGFRDRRAIELSTGNSVWVQNNAAGEAYVPFRMSIRETRITWMNGLPHGRPDQVQAWQGGRYNGWLDAKHPVLREYEKLPLSLGYYIREDLPFYYALADAFTICDQHFCSVMSSTYPNRLTMWAGTIRDNASSAAKANVTNGDFSLEGLRWETFPDVLQQQGISWRVYQNDLSSFGALSDEEIPWLGNFGCNTLEYFAQFNVKSSPEYVRHLPARIARATEAIQRERNKLETMPPSDPERETLAARIEQEEKRIARLREELRLGRGAFERLSRAERELNQRAFTTNAGDPDYRELTTLRYREGDQPRELRVPKGDVLHQFRSDVRSGKLPTVSWLVPSSHLSDHPTSPWYGQWYVSEIMNILTENPEVWKKTVFVLTYDENDGYFDHIPPFVVPDPTDAKSGKVSPGIDCAVEYIPREKEIESGPPDPNARGGPIGLGFRVPLIVASPWSRGGWVNSEVFDHTSTLQFLEQFLSAKTGKQISETNISQWRRTVCGDLSSAFHTYTDGKDSELPFVRKVPYIESVYNAKFKELPTDYNRLSEAQIAQAGHHPQQLPFFPVQEPGLRRSCALPYELYADGSLNKAGDQVEIEFRASRESFGDRARGAPFNVYAYVWHDSADGEPSKDNSSNSILRFSSYAVSVGGVLRDSWPIEMFPGGRYRICAYGPNGFFREFRGDTGDPAIQVACAYQTTGSRRLAIRIENATGKPQDVVIEDRAYGARPVHKTIHKTGVAILDFEGSHGWYDISVRVKGAADFQRVYAGRIETELPSMSDPAMAFDGPAT